MWFMLFHYFIDDLENWDYATACHFISSKQFYTQSNPDSEMEYGESALKY